LIEKAKDTIPSEIIKESSLFEFQMLLEHIGNLEKKIETFKSKYDHKILRLIMKGYIVWSLLFAFLLFSVAEPALAQMGTGPMDGQQMDRGRAFDMMEQGKGMRAERGMFGMGFMHSAGNTYGDYVTFNIDNKTGNVLNYGVNGETLFDISISNFNYGSSSSQGSITWVSNMDGSTVIQLHDNPAAVINILTNKSISVTFALAEDVTAIKEDNFVIVKSDSFEGYISGTGTVTSSVSSTQAKIDTSSNSMVVFRAVPVNMPGFDQMHRRFSQEIARNRIGMEIALGRNGTYDAVNYSAAMRLRVQEMTQNRIRLMVNSTDPEGNIIAINLDNSSLAIRDRDRLRIHLDGTPLQCVNDPDIVFDTTDSPLCWISPIQNMTRAQLMIHVPQYSEHTIDIIVEPEETPEATQTANVTMTTEVPAETPKTPGFELVVSLAGLLTWIYVVRWRNRNSR
jgi:hypothetical protein